MYRTASLLETVHFSWKPQLRKKTSFWIKCCHKSTWGSCDAADRLHGIKESDCELLVCFLNQKGQMLQGQAALVRYYPGLLLLASSAAHSSSQEAVSLYPWSCGPLWMSLGEGRPLLATYHLCCLLPLLCWPAGAQPPLQLCSSGPSGCQHLLGEPGCVNHRWDMNTQEGSSEKQGTKVPVCLWYWCKHTA